MASPGATEERRRSREAAAVCVAVLAALSVGGCAAASSATPPTAPDSSSTIVQATAASCAVLTASHQFAAAQVVFDADMLSGATVPGTNATLASPARVRVEHYLKGNGPAVVTVQTAIKPLHAGRTLVVSEDGIRPRAGERWRIYSRTASEPYSTSICLGSRRLPIRTAHFSSAGALSFDYPKTWHARTYAMPPAPFSSWLVWLSPQPMHPPCLPRHGTYSTTIPCGDPVSHLRPNSIRGYRDSWYQLTAFLRGPDTVGPTRQVRTMLRSVRWLG